LTAVALLLAFILHAEIEWAQLSLLDRHITLAYSYVRSRLLFSAL